MPTTSHLSQFTVAIDATMSFNSWPIYWPPSLCILFIITVLLCFQSVNKLIPNFTDYTQAIEAAFWQTTHTYYKPIFTLIHNHNGYKIWLTIRDPPSTLFLLSRFTVNKSTHYLMSQSMIKNICYLQATSREIWMSWYQKNETRTSWYQGLSKSYIKIHLYKATSQLPLCLQSIASFKIPLKLILW